MELTDAALAACDFPFVPNTDITLEGELQGDGTVVADFACPTAALGTFSEHIEGPIDSIDPDFGTLTILGMPVQPSITTLLKGMTSLAQLRVGDFVSARMSGAPVPGGWSTSRLDRSSTGTPRVDMYIWDYSVADPWIYIGGHPIATNAHTTFHIYSGIGNHPIIRLSRATFFAGPKSWPYYDKICTPALAVTIAIHADHSLTAVDALVEPGFC